MELQEIRDVLIQCGLGNTARLYYMGDNVNAPTSLGVFLLLGDSEVNSIEELAIKVRACLKGYNLIINKINSGCLSIATR